MNDEHGTEKALPRVASVRALQERKIAVVWRDRDQEEVVDIMPALLSRRIFVRLRSDDELFRSVRTNEDGNAVEWDDGAELSAIWIKRLASIDLDNADFRQAMDELNVSLDGMAAQLGIARRLVADYRKDKPIPKTVALAVRYLVEHQRKAS
ncbi:MAG: hypothetical protein ABI377_02350 [Devosia sp.]